jgi:DNA (cytosine-5)-methyltransferase 1
MASTNLRRSCFDEASSGLIALREYIDYARQASSDLFGDLGSVRLWWDFERRASDLYAKLVEHLGADADTGEILSLTARCRRNHPPRREAGARVAALTSTGVGTCGADDNQAQAGHLIPADVYENFENANYRPGFGVLRRSGGDNGPGSEMLVAHTLRAEGFDTSEDGTGRGVPLVPVPFSIMPMNSGKDYKARETDVAQPIMAGGPVGGNQGGDYVCQPVPVQQVAGTLKSCGGKSGQPNGAEEVDRLIPIAFPERLSGTQYASVENISPSLGAANPMAVAFAQNQRDELRTMDVAGSLAADPGMKQQTYVATQWAVRRLTVTECERLQGYPDGHTLIDFGSRRTVELDMAEYLRAKGVIVEADNRTGKLKTNAAADGPRYKSLGNAWAVACVRPIALKIYQRLTESMAA